MPIARPAATKGVLADSDSDTIRAKYGRTT